MTRRWPHPRDVPQRWRRRVPLALAAVGALALTTFTVPGGTPSPAPAGVEVAAPEVETPEVETSTRRRAPRVEVTEIALDGEPVGSALEIPSIAEDARDLTPFRSARVPESGDELVLPVDLLARAADGEAFDLGELDESLTGARHVAAAAELQGEATAAAGEDDDPHDVSVLGVHATSFRPLTPEVTATADAVWERLGDGEALLQHDVADELGVELGDAILLTTEDGVTTTLRVGALAANGTPPVADVLVSIDVARRLGHEAPNVLLLSVDGELDPITRRLEEDADADVDVRRPPPEPVAPPQQGTSPSGAIEPFTYTSHANGHITIHGDWVARNIVSVSLPGMPTTRCHRVMVPQLQAAVEELQARGLYGHLDPAQFGGCFNARHIDRNPNRPLSMHAWGLAIDFNTRDNALGAVPQMDPQVVEVFRRWGFKWGGDWRRPDGMHFELERIVSSG